MTLKKSTENDELKRRIRETAGQNTVLILEKELGKLLEPISLGMRELTSEKNKYFTPSEKEQLGEKMEKVVSKIRGEYWQEMLKPRHIVGQTIRKDLVGSFEKKAPFEESIDGAEKLILQQRSRVVTRTYLESIGLQPVVNSIGGKQIAGYTHSVFNDLTIEDIQTVISGWKEGKDFQEIAKNLSNKSISHQMNEKKIIAIMRGVVISGVPQGKGEAVGAVVNAVENGRELSPEEREKYKLSDLEYKGIRNSIEITIARKTLAASLDFFQKNYSEVRLGEKGIWVKNDLLKIGPDYIKKILTGNDSAAWAYKLEGGAGAVKRFNLDENLMPYMDANGRSKEISSSGRMAAFAFIEPWDIEPFRMLIFEHMVPSQKKDVTIDGMKSEDGKTLWDKLKDREYLGLTDKDSFVIFITSRQFASEAVVKFRERMQDVQEKGGLSLSDYINKQLASGKPVETVKNDVHPFIQSEVELTAMIANARFEREREEDDR